MFHICNIKKCIRTNKYEKHKNKKRKFSHRMTSNTSGKQILSSIFHKKYYTPITKQYLKKNVL